MDLTGGASAVVRAPRLSSDSIRRTRLSEALLPLAAVTVVRGPGGAGKTVLLRQLADETDAEAVWIDAATASRLEDIDGTDALADSDRPVVIVLDDAHRVADPELFRDILAVARSISKVSFLIGTRVLLPALEDPVQALTLDIRLVLPEELRFSIDEIATFIGESPQRAMEIERFTEGNALLLRALRLGADRAAGDDPAHGAIAVLRAHVLRYQVTAGRQMSDFMRRTCLGKDFTSAEAAELTGATGVDVLTMRLEQDGLVVRSALDDAECFRYPPFVREVLRAELAQRDNARVESLHGIVSGHRSNRGDMPGALHHALLARNYDFAARVLVRGGTDMLRQVPYEAFAQIPVRVAVHHPILAAARALKENARGARWVAREYFAAAIVASRSSNRRNLPERASMTVIESVSTRLQGRYKDSASIARRAMAMIDRLGPDSILGDQVYALMSTCGVSFFRAGALTELRQIVDRVPPTAMPGGLMASSLGAVMAAAAGDSRAFEEAEAAILAAEWPQDELDGYRGSLRRLAFMLRELGRADTEAARTHLEALRAHLPTMEFRVLFAAAEALAVLIEDRPEEARRIAAAIRRSEQAAGRLSPRDDHLVTLVEVLTMSASGRPGAAQKHLNAVPLSSPWRRIVSAHLALLQRDHAAAAPHLAASTLTGADEPRIIRTRLLLLAWLSSSAGDPSSAHAALIAAASVAEVHGEDGALMLIPYDIRVQLTALLDGDESIGATRARSQLLAPLPSPFRIIDSYPQLTKRERVVLSGLQLYDSNAELAAALVISPNTVKTQLRSAYRKLRVTNRAEALVRMAVLGIDGDGGSPE